MESARDRRAHVCEKRELESRLPHSPLQDDKGIPNQRVEPNLIIVV